MTGLALLLASANIPSVAAWATSSKGAADSIGGTTTVAAVIVSTYLEHSDSMYAESSYNTDAATGTATDLFNAAIRRTTFSTSTISGYLDHKTTQRDAGRMEVPSWSPTIPSDAGRIEFLPRPSASVLSYVKLKEFPHCFRRDLGEQLKRATENEEGQPTDNVQLEEARKVVEDLRRKLEHAQESKNSCMLHDEELDNALTEIASLHQEVQDLKNKATNAPTDEGTLETLQAENEDLRTELATTLACKGSEEGRENACDAPIAEIAILHRKINDLTWNSFDQNKSFEATKKQREDARTERDDARKERDTARGQLVTLRNSPFCGLGKGCNVPPPPPPPPPPPSASDDPSHRCYLIHVGPFCV